jgi:hypothetical protein
MQSLWAEQRPEDLTNDESEPHPPGNATTNGTGLGGDYRKHQPSSHDTGNAPVSPRLKIIWEKISQGLPPLNPAELRQLDPGFFPPKSPEGLLPPVPLGELREIHDHSSGRHPQNRQLGSNPLRAVSSDELCCAHSRKPPAASPNQSTNAPHSRGFSVSQAHALSNRRTQNQTTMYHTEHLCPECGSACAESHDNDWLQCPRCSRTSCQFLTPEPVPLGACDYPASDAIETTMRHSCMTESAWE